MNAFSHPDRRPPLGGRESRRTALSAPLMCLLLSAPISAPIPAQADCAPHPANPMPGHPAQTVTFLAVSVPAASPIEHLDNDELADIFLRRWRDRTSRLAGLNPLDRDEPALKAAFYQQVARYSLTRLRAYWAQRVFTGRQRPPATLDPREADHHYAQNPRVISYFRGDAVPRNSRVVACFSTHTPLALKEALR